MAGAAWYVVSHYICFKGSKWPIRYSRGSWSSIRIATDNKVGPSNSKSIIISVPYLTLLSSIVLAKKTVDLVNSSSYFCNYG